MLVEYEKWVKKHYTKSPIIQKIMLDYWKTMHDLTKRVKPENFRYQKTNKIIVINPSTNRPIENLEDVFSPLLDCEIGPRYDKEITKIIGWGIKFQFGNYPDEVEYRKTMELAISNLLRQIPNTIMITSSLDITPFLDLTPDLKFLSLHSLVTTKNLSPKIGLRSLKKLHTIHFRTCNELEKIPPEIGDLPNLQSLVFEVCPNLKEIPPEVGKLPNLRELKIMFCNSLETVPVSICEIPTFKKIVAISQPDDFRLPSCFTAFISPHWYKEIHPKPKFPHGDVAKIQKFAEHLEFNGKITRHFNANFEEYDHTPTKAEITMERKMYVLEWTSPEGYICTYEYNITDDDINLYHES